MNRIIWILVGMLLTLVCVLYLFNKWFVLKF